MPSGENSISTRFSSDNQPLTNGKPIGTKNRSTIARKILEMSAIMPDDLYEEIKKNFPEIEKRMTTEEIATIAILGAAIAKKDVQAYKAIMDSAYGLPKGEIEHSGDINMIAEIRLIQNGPLPVSDEKDIDV